LTQSIQNRLIKLLLNANEEFGLKTNFTNTKNLTKPPTQFVAYCNTGLAEQGIPPVAEKPQVRAWGFTCFDKLNLLWGLFR
jgi:hypothetical protein